MKGLFYLILAGAGFYLLNKKNVAEKLQFYSNSVSLKEGKLYYRLDIVNPTTTKLYFDNLFATIESMGLIVGRIQYVGRTYIAPQGTTTVNFIIKVVWLDLGTWLAKVYKGEIKDVDVRGTINSMGLSIPFEAKVPLL